MKRLVFIAVLCAFVATPAFAELVLTYDMSAAQLTYTLATKTLTVTETLGSDLQVRKEDDGAGVIIDNTQIEDGGFGLTLELALLDLPGANNWSGMGSFSFTDTGAANVVEAAVQTTSITMDMIVANPEVYLLVVQGALSDLGSNTRILVGSDPWVFNGESEIGGEPTEGTANQITMFGPENYDSGFVLTLKFAAPGGSLDGLLSQDRGLSGGEVKGAIVPVPAAVLLGMLGLSVAGLGLRKRA